MNWTDAINILNTVSAITLFGLTLATLVKQGKRVLWYHRKRKDVPIILKRGMYLMASVVILYASTLAIRLLGWADALRDPSELRFAYILFTALVVIVPVAFYTKTEYIDVEDPDKV